MSKEDYEEMRARWWYELALKRYQKGVQPAEAMLLHSLDCWADD